MGSCYLMGGEFQFYKMITFTEMNGGDGCIHTHTHTHTINELNATELYTKNGLFNVMYISPPPPPPKN